MTPDEGREMNGATHLVRALEREGVDVVFGYPGGAIMPVYDALLDSPIRHVLVRHEQGAALAAVGYARSTGGVGVCMATSGPGATNLVTGIADAFADSVPLVAVTGQVASGMLGTDAFQEVDIFGMTMPVVKHSFLVRRTEDLPGVLQEAFHIARSGRPGPVLVDLPKDVATGVASEPTLTAITSDPAPPPPSDLQVRQALDLLRASEQPVLYAGGGVGMAGAVEELRGFVEATGMPTVTTLKGLGVLPTDHECFLGMLGMHGSKAANTAIQGADLLVAVGVRFDDRATGKLAEFAPGAKVIHLDIDPAEVGKLRPPDAPVVGDIRAALRALSVPVEIGPWRSLCLFRKETTAWPYDAPGSGIYAPRLLKALSEASDERTIVSCDVGQHQMWVAQHWRHRHPSEHLSSGGLGTMGFGLPAAMGAATACPDARVINVAGDGSFMMNVQELATVRRYDIPVKILILDNQALGLVRQWQDLFFDGRESEIDLSDNPDFVQLAKCFGIPGMRATRAGQEEDVVRAMLDTDGPFLAHVLIDREANVWPLVPPGADNATMLEGAAR
ncbi:MAG: acetolactate synthase 2 catalytic subunit [Myxococcota bacterium]